MFTQNWSAPQLARSVPHSSMSEERGEMGGGLAPQVRVQPRQLCSRVLGRGTASPPKNDWHLGA